jgi:serine/threonine protein kinase/formylglycine-generating enzyme required for sulfatase activity
MTTANPRLAALSDKDRQACEAWLVAFEQGWDEQRLVRRAEQIPAGSSWRLPALVEMVKIDLERQWQQGRRVSLESYLQEFPELGSPGDVSADLIQAEFAVRRQFGAPAALEDYLVRFPHQAAELARLIAQGGSAVSRHPASADRKPAKAPAGLPEQFGRYRLIKRLGQGGMGSVYLAEDSQLQRQVALKVASEDTQETPEARRRLLAEARAAATLDHPYLCPVYDAGEVDGRLYLTMAYIEGQSLAEAAEGKSLPPRQLAALVGKLALALQEAHAKGVVHRDLKPSNVMIKSTGQRREPVIVDFGLAHRDNPSEARITKTGQVMGTLDYMAPEQLRGELKEIGPACDIYALGVILYELLTGRLPFSGSGLAVIGQILTQEPLPLSTIRPDLDPRLEAICLKAMAKTAASRYASMADLAAALTDFLRAPSPSAMAAAAPPPAPAAPRTPPAGPDTLVARLLDRVAEEPASTHPTSGQSQAGGTRTDRSKSTWTSSSGDSLPPELAALPGYEIKRKLGQGGMGVVYLAHNRMMGRDEVLKVMGQHLMGYPGALERFMREIRSVARLHHQNIVTAYHAVQVGQSLLFAMEFVNGQELSELVKNKGPMPVAHARLFTYQAALGLQHAHEEGLIHRDLKPNNLILYRKGDKATVKILDFGLAKAAREGVEAELNSTGPGTPTGAALGTPAYMAPEQITDAAKVDIRADIYSLGGTLYFLLAGRPPFVAKTQYELYQAHISRIPDPLNLVRPDVPGQLAALVAKMLAKDPAERFQTPGEVAQALKPFCTKAYAGPVKGGSSGTGSTAGGQERIKAGQRTTVIETPEDRLRPRPPKGPKMPGTESTWGGIVPGIDPPDDEPPVARRPATPWLWPAVAVGALMLGLLAAWMGSVFKVKTQDGVGMIVLENVPKDSEILVDGETITLSWPGAGKPLEIRKAPGQHKVEVKKDGFKTFGEVVTVKTDVSEEVTVRLERLVVDQPEPKKEDAPQAKADILPELKTEVVELRPVNKELNPPNRSTVPYSVVPKEITNSIGMKFVLIPAGEFVMGAPDSDPYAGNEEKPQHRVRITRPFYLGVTEVTQGQYRAVTSANPSRFKGSDDLPVEQVSWEDAIAFCDKLSANEGLSYRLPTEAEWEYACRAGGTTTFNSGDDYASLGEVAWYKGNSGNKTHPVGHLRPNAWGLFDMHGNVHEWCRDWYAEAYYGNSSGADPLGPSEGAKRASRGGSWDNFPRYARSALRWGDSPAYRYYGVGFRVARVQTSR